jgi:hypothetical protein
MPFSSYVELQSTVLDWLARPGDPLVAPAVPDMIAMFEEEARDRLQTRFAEKTVQLSPTPGLDTIPLPLDYGELRSIWINTASGKQHFQFHPPRNLDMNLGLYALANYPAAYTIEGLNLRIVGTPVAATTDGEPAAGGSGPEVTLTPAASSTLYRDTRIVSTSFVGLMPLTANAADALGSVWVEPGTGTAVIHHASSLNTDQTFAVSLVNASGVESGGAAGAINIDYLSGIPPLSPDMPSNWLLAEYPSAYLFGTLAFAAPYIGDDPRIQLWLSARESAIERIRLADRRAKFPHGLMIQTDVRNP